MAKKQKYYVVWEGKEKGIFDSWEKTQELVKNFQGAKYKSFDSKLEAEAAFKMNYWKLVGQSQKIASQKTNSSNSKPILPSLSVDAACAGNPGVLEYQGVDTNSKNPVFKRGPFPIGTINLGEFLAIVHGLALLKKEKLDYPIYSDSRTAMAWVRNKAIKTNLERGPQTEELFSMIDKALQWLKENPKHNKVYKWETEIWGENPADYGRK